MALHRTNKTKSSRKKIALLVISLLVIVAGVVLFVLLSKQFRTTNVDTPPSNSSQNNQVNNTTGKPKSDSDIKQEFLDNNKGSEQENQGGSTPKPEPTVDFNTEVSNSGETVVVKTNLSSVTSGTCTLTVTDGQKKITKTAEVIFAPEFSSCAGFTVKTAEVSGKNWNITLEVNTGTKTLKKNKTLNL